MKIPNFITFTGIDDRTDLDRAESLAAKYPIEWGVLFSEKNRDARFPCSQAIQEIIDTLGSLSAHLCGGMARDVFNGHFDDCDLHRFQRAQINGRTVIYDHLPAFEKTFGLEVILQTRSTESHCSAYSSLFDQSGGRGVVPEHLPVTYLKDCVVGYAGGIDPTNVIEWLDRIQGSGTFWIDMESGVRTAGWFDLDKVQAVCELVFE